MKKFQQIVYILSLLTAIAYIVFTLGFSTNWAIGQGYLGQFYIDAQHANQVMYSYSLWIIVLVGVSFVLRSQHNRRFYISNYVVSLALIIVMIIAGYQTIGFMGPLKAAAAEIDEIYVFLMQVINGGKITTTIFDVGVFISIILFINAALLMSVTVLKGHQTLMRVKKRKANLSGVTHEN